MSNDNQVLLVGPIDCNDRVNTFLVSFSLGNPERVAEETGGPGVDIARVGAVDMSALVESRWVVVVKDSSVDAVSARVAAIADELSALSLITIGLKNSEYTGTLVPRISECLEPLQEAPWDTRLVNGATRIEIVVRREPYVLAPTETLYSVAGFDCPALISLAAQTGQYEAPLSDMLLDALTLQLSGCYVGHTDDETAVIADFVKRMASASWLKIGGGAATGAAAADAAGYPAGAGDTVWETKDAIGDVTPIDVTSHSGQYAVFANVKYRVGAAGVYVKQQFGSWIPVTTSALRLLYLGTVSLPTQAVRGAETATLAVSIKGDGAANYAAINTVCLLPVSRGLTGYVLLSGHVHTLRWEGGTLYADDAVDLANVVGGAAPMRTLGGQLVVLAEQATPAPTTHLHATVTA
jgi:hypothetical protein